jgi:hypothetical protein
VTGIVAPTLGALVRHIVIGGLWHPVKRRAEAELFAELHTVRYPSFPFISPDTFRAMADIVIEGATLIRRSKMAQRNIIFFDLADITGDESEFGDSPALRALDRVLSELPVPPVVLMSHGDLLPKRSLLTRIGERSAKVFAVNLVEETENLWAIPLGLENLSRNRNGRLRDFDVARRQVEKTVKTNDVFAAFEPGNNPVVRDPLVELLRNSRFGWNRRRLSPGEFRRTVRESYFVISPPGRGLDCHRTWEAIYLGSVPVVLSSAISRSLTKLLPIHHVESFDEFLGLDELELRQLFDSYRDRAVSAAYAPYWLARIMSEAN